MVMSGGLVTGISHKIGDTGMYQFDLVSAILGYLVGVFLCFNTMHYIFVENKDETE